MKRMLQQSARCSGLSVAQIEVALDASAVLESRRGALEIMTVYRGSGSTIVICPALVDLVVALLVSLVVVAALSKGLTSVQGPVNDN